MNNFLRTILISVFMILSSLGHAEAAVGINGPTCVVAGEQYQYSISGTWTISDYMSWCINGGTIVGGSGSCISGTPKTFIYIIWNSNATNASVSVSAPSGNATLNISIASALQPGAISNTSQTVLATQLPAAINCSLPAGGYCAPAYSYQWESSPNGSTWTAISGATAQNYTFSTYLSATTYFRRVVTETNSGATAYSNTAGVTVNPPITITGPGCVAPAVATTYMAGGGYTVTDYFNWCVTGGQVTGSSTNCRSGTPLLNIEVKWTEGAVSPRVDLTAVGQSISKNVVVLVQDNFNIKSDQTILTGTIPAPITSKVTVPATCAGISYQWEKQTAALPPAYQSIAGAVSENLSFTAALTASMVVRRATTINGQVYYSNTASIGVVPRLVAGQIGSPVSAPIYYNKSPGQLSSITLPSGGLCNGAYVYLWQQSIDGTNFTDITGATAAQYTPGNLVRKTYYRRKVVCGTETAYSNIITIDVYAEFKATAIASPVAAPVNYNTSPGTIIGGTASGGGCSGTYTYQWESSANGTTFAALSGQINKDLTLPALVANTWYRLRYTCAAEQIYSNVIRIDVYPQLVPGTISNGVNYINYNTTAPVLTVSAASGGNNVYAYQWEQSTNNINWTAITGATALTYSPGILTATTYYRRKVVSNGVAAYAAVMVVNVYPPLSPGGAISPASITINNNTSPGTFTGTAATGGNGTYAYQWQVSPNNTSWSNITGAVSLQYTPGNLTATTYYRRMVTSNSIVAYSNVAVVYIYPALQPGAVTPAAVTINYNTSSGQLAVSPSGGSGIYSYQWQSSPDNITWTNITGATLNTYTSAALTALKYFRAVVNSNGVIGNSVPAKVTVYPELIAGAVSPATIAINYNSLPGVLTANPTGGSGTYTYQWQYSPNGSTAWANVSGAVAKTLSPAALTSDAYYRSIVTSNGIRDTTANCKVTVYAQLVSGVLSPAAVTTGFNGDASTLVCTAAKGGNGSYVYQWQTSPDNVTWSDVAGAASLSYAPGVVADSRYFRVRSTSNGIIVYSNVSAVTAALRGGIIQVSPVTGIPGVNATLTATTAASNGSCGSSYVYQWESSYDQISWQNLAGPASNNLQKTMYFRRKATCGQEMAYSNIVMLRIRQAAPAVILPDGTTAAPAGTAALQSMPSYSSTYLPQNMNYVRSRQFMKGGLTTEALAAAQNNRKDLDEVITYLDGLGNPIQTVNKQATPLGNDLVTTSFYDNFGRVTVNYLPYPDVAGNGNFKTDAPVRQKSFYDAYLGNTESYYYSKTVFDNSSLNQVLFQANPGKSLAGSDRGQYQLKRSNRKTENVRVWTVSDVPGAIPVSVRAFEDGQLSVSETVDEGENRTLQYMDKSGNLVLKKVQAADALIEGHDGWLCTYYVYDDFNQLRYVIPPKAVALIAASWSITQGISDELCFSYGYDEYRRSIFKKIPGAAALEMVYDNRDRLVFSQDGNLKLKQQWLMTTYDNLNRELQKSIYTSATATRASLQAMLGALPLNTNPAPSLPAASLELQSEKYYDDYSYAGAKTFVLAELNKAVAASGNSNAEAASEANKAVMGQVTGSKIHVIGTATWLVSTYFYDNKMRMVQTISDNHVGGTEMTSVLYDYSGKVLTNFQSHRNPKDVSQPTKSILTQHLYDDAGNLWKVTKVLNEDAVTTKTILSDTYDELGRMNKKELGNVNNLPVETLNYGYSIGGALKSVNKSYNNGGSGNYFGMELSFDYGFNSRQYNGNIAGVTWRAFNDGGKRRAYGYDYDNIGRLVKADFTEYSGSVYASNPASDFTVSNIRYDNNGNLLSMYSKGIVAGASTFIDKLNYSYLAAGASNKLGSVSDSAGFKSLGDFNDKNVTADDYDYDVNGNLKLDKNKDITTIRYNYLNLPDSIVISGKGTILYRYDATGRKLSKKVTDISGGTSQTNITDYLADFTYKNDTLEFIAHEEGRIRKVKKASDPAPVYYYDYFLKDHLGNTRTVITEQSDLSVYTATMETPAAAKETQLFSNLDNTRASKPAGYPSDPDAAKNESVAKLNAASEGRKIGPSLVLKVMAGDTIRMGVKAFYKSGAPVGKDKQSPVAGMVAAILQDLTGVSGARKSVHYTPFGSVKEGNTIMNNSDYLRMKQKNPDENKTDRPKAYLSYALFDEQFKMVDANSGVKQVQATPDQLQTLAPGEVVCTAGGFLYIYTSNESQQDVFFDNLTVTQATGPVLEETHYYPFGLTMAGISSNALKGTNYPKNRKEFNGIEHTTELDLNQYDAFYRNFDPQTGRWWQLDPKPNVSVSLYAALENNPVRFGDPLGDTLRIQFGTGFLGLGSKQQVIYNDGTLTNSDGTAYEGKVQGFLKKAVAALDAGRNGSDEAKSMIRELQGSKNNFEVVEGTTNEFIHDKSQAAAAYANQLKMDPGLSLTLGVTPPAAMEGGGGGTISWNPDGANVWLVGGQQDNNSTVNLMHELFHGQDANRGRLDGRTDIRGLKRDEWQATYKENIVRKQLGLPLREFYRSQDNGGTITPLQPRLLDANNNPIRPFWVPANW